jgi:peptidyl-prolyl cis-trans isomerase D
LQKYLDAHKSKFKREEETRKLQYVTFDIIPSAADTARTLNDLNEKFADFAASKTAAEDSVFVKLYSEISFDDKYYTKEELTSSMKDTLFAVANRTVVGSLSGERQFEICKSERPQNAFGLGACSRNQIFISTTLLRRSRAPRA